MLDIGLLGVALFFGVLSIIAALIIIRLPVYFQIWSLIGQLIIMSIGLTEAWLRWDTLMLAQHVVIDIGVMCLAAFPGLVLLDYMQRKQRISYWEKGNYPDELANKDLHINIWIALIAILWHIASYAERIYYIRASYSKHLGNFVNRVCDFSRYFGA